MDNVRLKRNGPQMVDYRDPSLLKLFRHVSGFGCVNGRNFPECRQPKRQIAGRGLGSESCVELVVGNENAPASHENISPSNLIPPGRWLQDRSLKWQIELAPEPFHQGQYILPVANHFFVMPLFHLIFTVALVVGLARKVSRQIWYDRTQ